MIAYNKHEAEQQRLKTIYQKCFNKWGYPSQLLLLAEETTELSLETLHMTRNNRQSVEQMGKFITEFADTKIMMAEFEWFFGKPFVDSVNDEIKRKISRLEQMLSEDV